MNDNKPVQVGDYVKVSRNAERFWVKLTKEKLGGTYNGVIDNDVQPVNGKCGDLIEVYLAEFVDVMRPPQIALVH